jgi:hypothetical protein
MTFILFAVLPFAIPPKNKAERVPMNYTVQQIAEITNAKLLETEV